MPRKKPVPAPRMGRAPDRRALCSVLSILLTDEKERPWLRVSWLIQVKFEL